MEPIAHIVGARPNFMKAAPVLAALAARDAAQVLIHTGQHYDERMSEVFFAELGIPEPDVNLGVGSGSHGQQTAALIAALEDELVARRPSIVVVYGDVNSTLAAAIVCSKLGIPLAHVEAGLRSFDRTMPEEINRVLTDQVSDLLLVTSPEAYAHLAREGVDDAGIRFVGNPMIDTLLGNLERFDTEAVTRDLGIEGRYAVATLHRPANVDEPDTAARMVEALTAVAAEVPIVLPLHPRGRAQFAEAGLLDVPGMVVIDPLGYVPFISLVRGAALVLTDSGGVQEETTILDVPCLTIRPNTERPVTITHGTNRLVTPAEVPDAARAILAGSVTFPEDRPPLWDGQAGRRCAEELLRFLGVAA